MRHESILVMDAAQKNPIVLVVGGGFGGIHLVKALRKAPVRVVLVDRNNHHLFQPLLYQVATAGLSPGEIAEPIRKIFKNQKNVEVLMAEVTRIDPKKNEVHLGERVLGYDYLVLAPGSRYNYFGHESWERIAPELKTLENALEIRQRILLAFEKAEMEEDPQQRQALLNFVIVGGGPTGVELAGAIAELAHHALAGDFRHLDVNSVRILLLEAGPTILPSFPPKLAEKARKELRKLGVEVRENAAAEELRETGAVVAGEFIPAGNMLWAAGVKASPLVRDLGCGLDRLGRALVGSDLSVPGFPNIFVIGDAASVMQGSRPLPGLAPVAIQEGRYVAKLIRSKVSGTKLPPPFHYVDKGQLATVGRAFAVAEIGKLKFGGFVGWLLWVFVHIFFLIGMQNRMMVFLQWVWYYFTFERGARLITFSGNQSKLG